ncbi:MAG: Hsp20/alpha crystallin family protein [Lachnospiraceae bacterium]|nr:Hsp20/alpha crystallin family protein [Lachnospiraceae bacterium]
MLTPSIFRRNGYFDDFDEFFGLEPVFKKQAAVFKNISSDVKETEDGYEIDMELPGFAKEDVKAQISDGYLTISAEHSENTDEKDKKQEKYIRRERYYGKCQRSFYVGDNITEEDVKGKFENGVLTMFVPKKEAKPQVEEEKYITIE